MGGFLADRSAPSTPGSAGVCGSRRTPSSPQSVWEPSSDHASPSPPGPQAPGRSQDPESAWPHSWSPSFWAGWILSTAGPDAAGSTPPAPPKALPEAQEEARLRSTHPTCSDTPSRLSASQTQSRSAGQRLAPNSPLRALRSTPRAGQEGPPTRTVTRARPPQLRPRSAQARLGRAAGACSQNGPFRGHGRGESPPSEHDLPPRHPAPGARLAAVSHLSEALFSVCLPLLARAFLPVPLTAPRGDPAGQLSSGGPSPGNLPGGHGAITAMGTTDAYPEQQHRRLWESHRRLRPPTEAGPSPRAPRRPAARPKGSVRGRGRDAGLCPECPWF